MAANFDWIKRLGSGHFGEVWLARDTGLNAIRAVKLIPPDKVFNPSNFFQEAQVLKLAEHANVVRIEETGKMADGRLYVVMQYHKRGSLDDEAKGAYVALTRAKRIMIDVLRGLEHAHSKGVLHCGIKPANILIGNANEGVLSDFGLAVPAGADLNAMGVKDYFFVMHLAPECHRKRRFSITTDLYAAGVTMYRLINGDSYLPSLTPQEIMKEAARGRFPSRSKFREFIPRPLRALVNKAIQVEPSKRFQTASQMRHALETLTLRMNWNEAILPNGVRWLGSRKSYCYEITRLREKRGEWSVVAKKGRSKTSLRRITNLCHKGYRKVKAEQLTRRMLQDYVLGKLN